MLSSGYCAALLHNQILFKTGFRNSLKCIEVIRSYYFITMPNYFQLLLMTRLDEVLKILKIFICRHPVVVCIVALSISINFTIGVFVLKDTRDGPHRSSTLESRGKIIHFPLYYYSVLYFRFTEHLIYLNPIGVFRVCGSSGCRAPGPLP